MKNCVLLLILISIASPKFLSSIINQIDSVLTTTTETETVTRTVYGKKLTLPVGDKFYFMPYKKDNTDSDGETQKDHLATHGDCTLIESNGKFAMVDLYRRGHYHKVKNFLEDLNVKEIEFVVLTHQHKDHRGDLERLSKDFKVKKLFMKDWTKDNYLSDSYLAYKNFAIENGIEFFFVSETENTFIKFENLDLEFYNRVPISATKDDYENGNSLTVLVKSFEGKKIYIAGDIKKITVKKIEYNYGLEAAELVGAVDVYKVAHHGKNDDDNSKEELKILRPKYSIITIDEKQGNVSDRLKDVGSKVYRAGMGHDGAIVVNVDPNGDITLEHTQ